MARIRDLSIAPGIIVNPGAGAIEERHSIECAAFNMDVLTDDLRTAGAAVGELRPMMRDEYENEPMIMGGTWNYQPPEYDDEGKFVRYRHTFDGEHDGRYPFYLTVNGVRHVVEMPGIREVRYMGEPGQNIFDFPRLFIDGSSWIWSIAIGVLSDPDDG